jgi:Uncharacterized protein with a C-terminal OMP (outer membrane protein) domain
MAFLWAINSFAGEVITDQYKFEFNGVLTSTIPSSPAVTSVCYSSTATTYSMFAVANGAAALNANSNVLFSGGGSGGRGSAIYNLNGNTALSTTKKEILEFDWNPATTDADPMAYNAIGISDYSKNPIFVLVSEAWTTGNSGIHLMNLTPSSTYLTTAYMLQAATYSGSSNYASDCATFFTGSWLGADFVNNKTYHIKVKMDFTTHMIDQITITRSDDATKQYVGTNIAFLSSSATNVDRVSAVAARGKNATNSANGANSMLWMSLDNYYVYTTETAATANVAINYYDADNLSSLIKSTTTAGVVGGTYSITGTDKASFTNSGYYYVYSSTIADNVSVTADGLAHVDIAMKKYPATSATYTWTGIVDGTWNELNGNFTTNGSNSMGFQPGNGIEFPASGTTKTVTVDNNYDLGTGDLTISGDGYTLGGNATLTGTGKINVNLSGSQAVTLNVTSNLSGTTAIAGGNVTLSKSGVIGSSVAVNGASTLIAGANGITIPSATLNASSTIDAGAKYGTIINGITAGSGVKVSVSGNYNTSNANTVANFAASGTLSAGSELELNGTGTTENKFGMTSASTTYLANAKVSLKGNAFLFINANQAAATTINVGTLAGEAGSKLGWGASTALDRTITWSVGALNENSEFAGTITNTGGYAGGGSMYLGNLTNLTKVGTGTLTLSGASTHNGAVAVSEGSLNVTGSLGAGVTTTVASGATLRGTGTISGATTVNGTLEGSLNFGSTLTLAGTTNLTVNGFNTGEYNVVNVTNAATTGGTLNVTVNAATAPEVGTAIKLINAGSYAGGFTAVNVPSGYAYTEATGTLTYNGTGVPTAINNGKAGAVSIYPTLIKGRVNVTNAKAATIEVSNVAGVTVEIVKSTDDNTSLQLSALSNGAYIVKVRLADGSVKVQKVILQK